MQSARKQTAQTAAYIKLSGVKNKAAIPPLYFCSLSD